MRKNGLLIVLFACIAALFGIVSCTYDYFEDETNYQVFVPEILDNSITDCRVMVYTEAGVLVKERYASYPWGKDPREQIGLFSFRLMPGKYNVYCYTNTDNITFSETGSLETSTFTLNECTHDEGTHLQPSNLHFHKLTPSIVHPGMLKVDTAQIERYVGRIFVRFKNLANNDLSTISDVKLRAEKVGTRQYLKEDTLTCSVSDTDIMFDLDKLPATRANDDVLEVNHRYLPTIDSNDIVSLEYTFLNSSGESILRLPVELKDPDTDLPIRLFYGQDLYLEIDRYVIVGISLEGWSDDIQEGGTDLE